MSTNKNFEFIVTKKSFAFVLCQKCDGTGKHSRIFRKMHFVENCRECGGEGRRRHFVMTEEFPLVEALKELSIIK